MMAKTFRPDGTVIYEGDVYVRPLSRGICLLDYDGEANLEDILDEGYWEIQVVATRLTGEALEAARKKPL